MSFPVILIFIAFAMCNMCKAVDERKTVIEGDDVQLNFPYPCNSTRVTLQYGIRVPFYSLADTESISLPPLQVHRFTFKKKKLKVNAIIVHFMLVSTLYRELMLEHTSSLPIVRMVYMKVHLKELD